MDSLFILLEVEFSTSQMKLRANSALHNLHMHVILYRFITLINNIRNWVDFSIGTCREKLISTCELMSLTI